MNLGNFLIVAFVVIGGFVLGYFLIKAIYEVFFRKHDEVAEEPRNEDRVIQEQSGTQQPAQTTVIRPIVASTPTVVEEQEDELDEGESVFFTLSRTDVLDHVDTASENKQRFPVEYNIKKKTDESAPDFIRCSERCFGMVFEREELVFVIALRMSPELVDRYGKRYTIAYAEPLGEDWHYLTVNNRFTRKQEVYNILDACYDYALAEHRRLKADAKAMAREQAALEKRVADLDELEESNRAAEQEYKAMLAQIKAQYGNFIITRPEIVNDWLNSGDEELTILDRFKNPRQPSSFKVKDKTFAMIYGTDMGLLMITQIPVELAHELSRRHPEIARASFPVGKNWYQLPIDGAFPSKQAVYDVMVASREFVKNKKPGKPRYAKKEDGTAPAKKAPAKKK